MATAILLELLLLPLLVLPPRAWAQDNRPTDPNNHFVYPPAAGPQYSGDSSVFDSDIDVTIRPQSRPFTWVSDIESMSLSMHQEGDISLFAERSVVLRDCSNSTSVLWDGNLGPKIDLSNGNRMLLAVWNCSAAQGSIPVFFSHYFNLIEPDSTGTKPSPSSSSPPASLSSSKSINTPTSSSSIATSPLPTSHSIPTSISMPLSSDVPSSSDSNGLDSSVNASAIGGGIGGGVGGAILIVGIIFAVLEYRKRRSHPVKELGSSTPASWLKEAPPPDYQYGGFGDNNHGGLAELEITSRIPELPAGRMVPEMPATPVTRTRTGIS